jgi:hypothetical protein
MLEFIWILDGMKVDPRCDVGGTKVKHRWNNNENLMEIKWGYKWKQYFFNRAIVMAKQGNI